MKTDRTKSSARNVPRDRFTVLDFAEAAEIPTSKARKLIRELGNDAEILMKAIEERARRVGLRRA